MSRKSEKKSFTSAVITLNFDKIAVTEPASRRQVQPRRQPQFLNSKNNKIHGYKLNHKHSLSANTKSKHCVDKSFVDQFQAFNLLAKEEGGPKNFKEKDFTHTFRRKEYEQKLIKKEKEDVKMHWAEEIVSKVDLTSIEVAQSKYEREKKMRYKRIVLSEIGGFAREKTKSQEEFETQQGDENEINQMIKAKIQDRISRVIMGRKSKTIETVQNGSPKQFWKGLVKQQKKLFRQLNPKFPMRSTYSMLNHFDATLDLARQSISPNPSRPQTTSVGVRKNLSFL